MTLSLIFLYPPLQVSSTLTLINIVLYPPLQSLCVLCDSRAIYSSHSNKSEGAWGHRPNERGPCSQRGPIWWHGKSCFPHSTLVFVQTGQTVSPCLLCSPLLSVLALFFPFFPFIQTCQLRQRHHRRHHLHLTLPSHRRYPVSTTSTPQLPHQPWLLQLPPRHPLQGAKHLLDSPSHTLQAHTSHPTTITLTVPSAP